MLREVDRIAVGIMNPVFSLAVWRSFVDAGRSVEFFTRLSKPSYILHLEHGEWKVVQVQWSVPQPNEEVFGRALTVTLEELERTV